MIIPDKWQFPSIDTTTVGPLFFKNSTRYLYSLSLFCTGSKQYLSPVVVESRDLISTQKVLFY